ncbi:MAG TPA: glycosyltransferase family 4 protein [Bacteroidota bacterium]
MNILVINWQDLRNPQAGGAEVQFQQVFSRLAAAGHGVTLLCSSFPDAPPEETLGGVRVLRRGARPVFNYLVPGLYARLTRRERFDVVVDDMNKVPFFTPLFVREPLCGLVHHLFGRSIYREVGPLTSSYVYAMERAALSLYRRRGIPFMVVSPSTREDMLASGFAERNLCVVPLAVDHALFRPTGVPRSTRPLLGYVGRLKRYKSIDHLIASLPAVRQAVPDAGLVIIGEGDDRGRLERLVGQLGLAGAVEFAGFVPEEEKVRRLQEIWCMVMPSSKEGWGLTVTEANACGTPAVASNVPGLRDAVIDGETGLLYPYGDVGALARCAVAILSDSSVRDRMAARAVEFAARFTWEESAERTSAFLSAIIRDRRGSAT